MSPRIEANDAIRGRKIIVAAEGIKIDKKRVALTSAHTGMKAVAKGEAFAYIDLPFESVSHGFRSKL